MDSKSSEYKKLRDEWYSRLKTDGFKDIEDPNNSSYLKWSLQQLLTRKSNKDRLPQFQVRENYYRIAGHFFHDHSFKNATEKLIWKYHAEGKTMREISKIMKQHKVSIATTQVKESIHRVRAEMLNKYGVKAL